MRYISCEAGMKTMEQRTVKSRNQKADLQSGGGSLSERRLYTLYIHKEIRIIMASSDNGIIDLPYVDIQVGDVL